MITWFGGYAIRIYRASNDLEALVKVLCHAKMLVFTSFDYYYERSTSMKHISISK